MNKKLKRKFKRMIKRLFRNRTITLGMCAVLFLAGAAIYTNTIQNKRFTVNPASYTQLLQLIGRAESNNNYNAYFANPGNTSVEFTKMSIDEVLAWQAAHVNEGNFSSAVGRYQIVNTTLSGLVKRLNIDTKQKFDPAMQDMFAVALLERRGSEKYVNDELTREQLAANLAMEWAALPKVIGDNPGDSYYAGDGVNKSRIEVDEILSAIEVISPK